MFAWMIQSLLSDNFHSPCMWWWVCSDTQCYTSPTDIGSPVSNIGHCCQTKSQHHLDQVGVGLEVLDCDSLGLNHAFFVKLEQIILTICPRIVYPLCQQSSSLYFFWCGLGLIDKSSATASCIFFACNQYICIHIWSDSHFYHIYPYIHRLCYTPSPFLVLHLINNWDMERNWKCFHLLNAGRLWSLPLNIEQEPMNQTLQVSNSTFLWNLVKF